MICDMLARPFGRYVGASIMPYLVVFGVVAFKVYCNEKCYCGNVKYDFCGEMKHVHFNVIMEHYIPYFILWL